MRNVKLLQIPFFYYKCLPKIMKTIIIFKNSCSLVYKILIQKIYILLGNLGKINRKLDIPIDKLAEFTQDMHPDDHQMSVNSTESTVTNMSLELPNNIKGTVVRSTLATVKEEEEEEEEEEGSESEKDPNTFESDKLAGGASSKGTKGSSEEYGSEDTHASLILLEESEESSEDEDEGTLLLEEIEHDVEHVQEQRRQGLQGAAEGRRPGIRIAVEGGGQSAEERVQQLGGTAEERLQGIYSTAEEARQGALGAAEGRSVHSTAEAQLGGTAEERIQSAYSAAEGRQSTYSAAGGHQSAYSAAEERLQSIHTAAEGGQSIHTAAEGRHSIHSAAEGRSVHSAAEERRQGDIERRSEQLSSILKHGEVEQHYEEEYQVPLSERKSVSFPDLIEDSGSTQKKSSEPEDTDRNLSETTIPKTDTDTEKTRDEKDTKSGVKSK